MVVAGLHRRTKRERVLMASTAYAAVIIVAFGYGLSTYFRRRPKLVLVDSDFAYVRNLHKQGLIDDKGFEAMVLLINDPDVVFKRPKPPTMDERKY